MNHGYPKKCLAIAVIARMDHKMLNQIRVGIVFTVDDQIKDKLESNAKTYSHQI